MTFEEKNLQEMKEIEDTCVKTIPDKFALHAWRMKGSL